MTDILELALRQISRKNFASKKINHISDIAKKSFGITFGLQILTLQLKVLIEQVHDVEVQIKQPLKKINTPIITIPVVGDITGATILSEIGDIERFSNPSKLVVYADIDA